jgi:UDP-N-acetylmuramyl pentapeptide phosphotransferase/UDP-N-acetylglucosamine-1-phosphate transferase
VTVAVAIAVGFLAARLVWVMLRPVFGHDLFQRENYRGRRLPTGAGIVLALALLVVEAGRAVVSAAADGVSGIGAGRAAVLVLVLGLALLGLLDDLAGSGERRGFRGHVRSMAEGTLTTGAVKMVGGGAIAALAVAVARPSNNLLELLTDAALVALAANLGNLFDLAPGRAIKVSMLAFAVLVATTALDPRLSGPAVVVGAAFGLLFDDLRERLMLGDTGANLLGGVLGLGVVIVGSPVVRLATLGVLAILNGMSEWVSFSRVIDRVPPLRLLDRAGRRA